MQMKKAKQRRLERTEGMVNINLRKVSKELRAELKRIASLRGITLEGLCVEVLCNEVGRGSPVRAAGETPSGGKVVLDGIGVESARAEDVAAVAGGGCGSAGGGEGGDSAGGVESRCAGGGESGSSVLGQRTTTQTSSIVGSVDCDGDSDIAQASPEAEAVNAAFQVAGKKSIKMALDKIEELRRGDEAAQASAQAERLAGPEVLVAHLKEKLPAISGKPMVPPIIYAPAYGGIERTIAKDASAAMATRRLGEDHEGESREELERDRMGQTGKDNADWMRDRLAAEMLAPSPVVDSTTVILGEDVLRGQTIHIEGTASVAAHTRPLAIDSLPSLPKLIDSPKTAQAAVHQALAKKKPAELIQAKPKKRFCKFCEKPLERWSATTLRCTGCGRNEAL